jgi:hypothetical protein
MFDFTSLQSMACHHLTPEQDETEPVSPIVSVTVSTKRNSFAASAAAAEAKRQQEQAAAEAAALLREQERIALEESAAAAAKSAAAAAAAAEQNAVLQAISSFLGGNVLLRESVISFCKVAAVAPLEALRAMRSAAVVDATLDSPPSSAAAALLSVLLSHCDHVHPFSSLAFTMMCHVMSGDGTLSPPSSPSSSSSSSSSSPAAAAAASSSRHSSVSSIVIERALCHHSKTESFSSFAAMLSLMDSIGLIKRSHNATLSVPQAYVHASTVLPLTSSSAASSSVLLSVSSALQETFWSTAVSPVSRTSHFHQLAYALTSRTEDDQPAAAAAASLLPQMQDSLQRLREAAARTSQSDDIVSAIAETMECVGAAHGILAGTCSSLPSSHLDLQISSLTECVSLKEKLHGPQSFDVCQTLLSLAVAYLRRAASEVGEDRSGEDAAVVARGLLERALVLQETKFGSGHVEVCQCCCSARNVI